MEELETTLNATGAAGGLLDLEYTLVSSDPAETVENNPYGPGDMKVRSEPVATFARIPEKGKNVPIQPHATVFDPRAGSWTWKLRTHGGSGFVRAKVTIKRKVVELPLGTPRTSPLPERSLAPEDWPLPAKINAQSHYALALGRAPRLVVGLTRAHVTPVSRLEHVPTAVVDRLRAGLSTIWEKQDGFPETRGLPTETLRKRAGGDLPAAEEVWARQVAEMLTLTPYAGYVPFYVPSRRKELELFAALIRPTDPVYGLVAACQYLAQFGVASRGLKLPQPLNAGSSAAKTIHGTSDGAGHTGAWFVAPGAPLDSPGGAASLGDKYKGANPSLLQTSVAIELRKDDATAYGPGAVYLSSNAQKTKLKVELSHTITSGGKRQLVSRTVEEKLDGLENDNSGDAHIAFVLRVDQDRKRVQLLDTGGSDDVSRKQDVTVGGSGNYEGPWISLVRARGAHGTSRGDPFRGIGVVPRLDAAALKNAAESLRRARPLGLARLVLWKRGTPRPRYLWDGGHVAQLLGAKPPLPPKPKPDDPPPVSREVLYASPWLFMHHGEENFALSRYFWSLRELPADVEAWWLVSLPRDWLAERLMAPNARKSSLSALIAEAREKALAKVHPSLREKKRKGLTDARLFGLFTLPLLDIATKPNGSMRVRFMNTSKGPRGRPAVFRDLPPLQGHNPGGFAEPAYLKGT